MQENAAQIMLEALQQDDFAYVSSQMEVVVTSQSRFKPNSSFPLLLQKGPPLVSVAAFYGSLRCFLLLVNNGNQLLFDQNQTSPFAFAFYGGNRVIINTLFTKYGKNALENPFELEYALFNHHFDIFCHYVSSFFQFSLCFKEHYPRFLRAALIPFPSFAPWSSLENGIDSMSVFGGVIDPFLIMVQRMQKKTLYTSLQSTLFVDSKPLNFELPILPPYNLTPKNLERDCRVLTSILDLLAVPIASFEEQEEYFEEIRKKDPNYKPKPQVKQSIWDLADPKLLHSAATVSSLLSKGEPWVAEVLVELYAIHPSLAAVVFSHPQIPPKEKAIAFQLLLGTFGWDYNVVHLPFFSEYIFITLGKDINSYPEPYDPISLFTKSQTNKFSDLAPQINMRNDPIFLQKMPILFDYLFSVTRNTGKSGDFHNIMAVLQNTLYHKNSEIFPDLLFPSMSNSESNSASNPESNSASNPESNSALNSALNSKPNSKAEHSGKKPVEDIRTNLNCSFLHYLVLKIPHFQPVAQTNEIERMFTILKLKQFNVNAQDIHGNTALHLIFLKCPSESYMICTEFTNLLLANEKTLDLSLRNKNGEPPILTFFGSKIRKLEPRWKPFLAHQKQPLNEFDPYGRPIFFTAAFENSPCHYLYYFSLNRKWNKMQLDKSKNSFLHFYCLSKAETNYPIIQGLLIFYSNCTFGLNDRGESLRSYPALNSLLNRRDYSYHITITK